MDDTPNVMLVAEGALVFTLNADFEKKLLTEKARKSWVEWQKKAEYS